MSLRVCRIGRPSAFGTLLGPTMHKPRRLTSTPPAERVSESVVRGEDIESGGDRAGPGRLADSKNRHRRPAGSQSSPGAPIKCHDVSPPKRQRNAYRSVGPTCSSYRTSDPYPTQTPLPIARSIMGYFAKTPAGLPHDAILLSLGPKVVVYHSPVFLRRFTNGTDHSAT